MDVSSKTNSTNHIPNGLNTDANFYCDVYEGGNLLDYGPAKEIKIPTPYGHIAAKEWGPETGQPVLGIHGWQDNAGTFDKVAAYLPDTLHLIVIDLPGHGLSSHLPNGSVYSANQYLVDLRRILSHLGWTKFSFLTHSFGAYLAFYYAAIHPEQIVKFVSLDILYPGTRFIDAPTARKFLDICLKEEGHEFAPRQHVFPFDMALDLMWQRREGMTKEGVEPLMARGCIKTEDGVVFTRDHRLKYFINQPWEYSSEQTAFTYLKNIRCDMLVIAAIDSEVFKRPGVNRQSEAQKILEESCTSFKIHRVEGGHFVHLVKPSVIGPILREFFLTF